MRDRGCAVVIITHKQKRSNGKSDRVTVLRKGRAVATVDTADVNVGTLIEMMVGKKVDLAIKKKKDRRRGKCLQWTELRSGTRTAKNALET